MNPCEAYKIMQVYVEFCRYTCCLLEDPSRERWYNDRLGRRMFIWGDDTDEEAIDRIPKIESLHGPRSTWWSTVVSTYNTMPLTTVSREPVGMWSWFYEFYERNKALDEALKVIRCQHDQLDAGEDDTQLRQSAERLQAEKWDGLLGWRNLMWSQNTEVRSVFIEVFNHVVSEHDLVM